MNVQKVRREFKLKTKTLEDPNLKMTVDQVRMFYSNEFPELVNATWKENQEGNLLSVVFETAVGKKG